MRPIVMLVLAALVAGCGSGDAPGEPADRPPAPAQTQPATAQPGEPEREEGRPARQRVPPIPPSDSAAEAPHPELFFLFADERHARAAAEELEAHGYRVRTTSPADDIPEWSVIAEGTPQGRDLEIAERTFRAWAQARGGRYDGNEIPVGP